MAKRLSFNTLCKKREKRLLSFFKQLEKEANQERESLKKTVVELKKILTAIEKIKILRPYDTFTFKEGFTSETILETLPTIISNIENYIK